MVTHTPARLRCGAHDTHDLAQALNETHKAPGADTHEARQFVRDYSTTKRLNSLPFRRYFVKKS